MALKQIFFQTLAATVSIFFLSLRVLAQTEEPVARVFTLGDAMRFFLYFLFVMGLIFLALLFTGWIGKKWKKHKK